MKEAAFNILKTLNMLKKDGKNITKDIKKVFAENFEHLTGSKKVAVFKLVNSIHNGKNKKPRSYRIPTKYVSSNSNGDTSEFIYFKNEQQKNIGGVMQNEYKPYLLEFGSRGDMMVTLGENQRENNDLFVWLMNHPRRAKNKNGDGTKRPIFYLEDKNVEAAEKVSLKEAEATMKKYLYDPESRLPEDDLRIIAKALRVVGVDNMERALVQTNIEKKCSKNPNLFLGMKSIGKEVEMRSNLHVASEKGILSFNGVKMKWILNNFDSGGKSELVTVRKTENEMDALIYWLKNKDENDHYGKIVELLTGKPTFKTASNPNPVDSDLALKLKLAEEENKKLALQLELAKSGSTEIKEKIENSNVGEKLVLENLNLEELRELAKKHNIEFHHMHKEPKLISLLKSNLPKEMIDFTENEVVN